MQEQTAINLLAKSIVNDAIKKPTREKNPAAVALGKLGGLKGGRARALALSAEERKIIAQKAARARWRKRIT